MSREIPGEALQAAAVAIARLPVAFGAAGDAVAYEFARAAVDAAAPAIQSQTLRDAVTQIRAWPDDAHVPVGVIAALLTERADDIAGATQTDGGPGAGPRGRGSTPGPSSPTLNREAVVSLLVEHETWLSTDAGGDQMVRCHCKWSELPCDDEDGELIARQAMGHVADVLGPLARPEHEVKAEAVRSAATAIQEDRGASSWIAAWLNGYADELARGGAA
jgi:hypothetical protein